VVEEPSTGVVVEKVAPGSPGEKAGLRSGDVILSWCRTAPASDAPCLASGAIESPFDFADLEAEQVSRGGVRLLGRRGALESAWAAGPGSLQIEIRPVLREELLALHQQAQGLAAAGQTDAAIQRWRAAAAEAGDDRLAAWFLVRAAKAGAAGERWQEADALYAEAIGRAGRGGGQPAAAHLLLERGSYELDRGDPARAEESFQRAASILAEVKAESLERAAVLNRLAVIAMGYRELDLAEGLWRRSLALREKLDPGSPAVAGSLHNLGILEMAREDDPAAVQDLERALALYTQWAPDSPAVAKTLSELAKPARHRGDFATAESYYRHVLSIREKAGPESLDIATCLVNLGNLATERGRLGEAERYYRRALKIAQRLAPEGPTSALVLLNLGITRGRRGFRRQAADLLCQTVDLSERRRETLGGTELARAWLAVTTRGYYHECLGARVQAGQTTQAFRILEMGRARAFLEQLAGRDLTRAPVPLEIARRRQALDAEYDQTQAQLGRLTPDQDPSGIERLRERLQELYIQQQELAAKIRETAQRSTTVRYPRPLDLASARRALDPGTVLLAYSVGDTNTFLFVVQPTGRQRGLTAIQIPIGDKALRAAVRNFRLLLESGSSDRTALLAQGRKLYDLLLRPVERRFAGAARLLISPDGPLHVLPFAALAHHNSFLAEWKPVHLVLSATVYDEIRKSRRPARPIAEDELVAFGAPNYPGVESSATPAADPTVATAVRRGLSLAPLPSSRQEVLGIASLFPRARIFLGAEATEEKVKTLAPQARFLHFACHGLLDERFPLNSGLALSIPEHPTPGQDNGLLQAWEIFEQVRLNADLITLSACDSGLGKEMGREGLMGLTRAFQYAGARSVLASLWSVADDSTAELMWRFYGYLKQGKSKDEALRAAQVDLIHGPEATSHPYHWAAFQLSGDWR